MKEKAKTLFKKIEADHPRLGFFLRKLIKGQTFNRIRKKVRGKGNIISYGNSAMSGVFFDIKGNNNRIKIASGCLLRNVRFFVRGDDHTVTIGSRCRFNRGGEIWIEDHHCTLAIGDRTTFESAHLAITEPGSRLTIGESCMFAYDIDVRTGDSHSILTQDGRERINYAEDVHIGNHVWVAAHCSILKGVHIADHSIVATGAVVTRRYDQPGVIIAGNPAKVIREGVSWQRERIYRDSDES